MVLQHVGLVCRSEQACDRFYGDLLGLAKAQIKTVAAGLAKQIFNREVAFEIINYTGPGVHFEIFLDPQKPYDDQGVAHVCLAVPDLEGFVETCRQQGVVLLEIPKPGGRMIFIRDDDGNLFEIKADS